MYTPPGLGSDGKGVNKVVPRQQSNRKEEEKGVGWKPVGRTNTGNASQFNDNAKGQQNTPHAVTGQGEQHPAATGLIHRMLDVPRGCALSPGGRGRASETAQVRGLGYPVSRRPAAGTPAPPAPDTTPKSAVTSPDSGQALHMAVLRCSRSRRGNLEGTVNGNLQIWSLSPLIPMAHCSGGRFEGRLWASDNPQKEWVSDGTLVLGTSVRLCFYASLPGTHAEKCD